MILSSILKSKITLLVIFGLLGYLGFCLGGAVLEKRAVDEKLSSLKAEIRELEEQKEILAKKEDYFESDDFIEKEARRLLSYQKPNEEVVAVIPDKEIQASEAVDSREKKSLDEAEQNEVPNPCKWWRYFFGKR